MADAIVSVVAEQIVAIIAEQISKEVNLVRGVEQKVLELSEELQTARNQLEDAEKKRFKDKSVRGWLVRLEDASYEMEDVLDEWCTALLKFQIQQQSNVDAAAPKNHKVCSFLSCLCFQKVAVRRDIAIKIESVKAKLDRILADKTRYGLETSAPPPTDDPSSWRVQSTSSVDLAEVHGRDIDRDVVASKILTAPTDHQLVEIVSIVGVGGVGKTTLAQLVFNDARVKDCFELKIWICVSDPFDVAKIVRGIIVGTGASSPSADTQLDMLLKDLTESISGKKFLLVLDDVWTEDRAMWEPLKNALKSCGGMGSKVLVTTRKEKVAKTLDTPENGIHRLGVLSDEACWLLLQRIALCGRSEGDCAQYKDIGMKIVDKCKGLPLAAKTLGSLLRCKNGLEEWENLLRSETWELKEVIEVELFPHLLLSYNELSPSLKRCFSYCAIFPKDTNIKVEEVIRQWMALGYLGSDIGSGGGDMELRGRQYFDNLAMRSLFQDFEKDENDGEQIMYFKLHDIVHDFARYLRNIGVEAGTKKKTSCQACSPQLVSQVKEYRSCFKWTRDSPICVCLSSLRVLNLQDSGIPQVTEKFIHLRWLDLSYNEDFSIFEGLQTICSELYNLQTLLLPMCNLKEIPRGIGNLINLRHLDLSRNKSLKELPREIENLINLRQLNLSSNDSLKELPREIGNLINLRHLNLSDNESLKELPGEIENLINLRHLDLSRNRSLRKLPESICGLRELQTLNIDHSRSIPGLPQGIHRLVNLKHLHNVYTDFIEQFPQGLAHLTCLRTLSEFRVGKNVGRLGLLKNLNRLTGSLELRISSIDVEDAWEGELRNKEYLQNLTISFDYDIDEVEDCVWMDVIDALQPHPNLQELIIWDFKGSRLPGWIASPINQVKFIRLSRADHSSSLPPLGKLPCLEKIEIYKMDELRFVGREFLGITTTTESESGHTNSITDVYFPKLKRLSLFDCSNWEEWEDITDRQEDEKVSFMPHLTSLSIRSCDSLAALPHRLLRKAAALEELEISGSAQLEQRYGDKEGSPWKSISNINPRIQLTMSS